MDSDQGKLFIGGISWETTEEKLKEYFENYGDVVQIVVMRDKTTGRPRGFGFVVFANPSILDRVLQDKHTIDARTVWLTPIMGFCCLVVIVMIRLLGLFCLFVFLLGYCGSASIFFFLCLFVWNSEFLSILEILCSCCEIVVLFNLCYHWCLFLGFCCFWV